MSQLPSDDHHGPGRYEITVQGRLAARWASWFDGFTVVTEEDGTTLIQGHVVDQSALHGLLHKVRDIGLPLVSVVRVSADQAPPDTPGNHPRKARP